MHTRMARGFWCADGSVAPMILETAVDRLQTVKSPGFKLFLHVLCCLEPVGAGSL